MVEQRENTITSTPAYCVLNAPFLRVVNLVQQRENRITSITCCHSLLSRTAASLMRIQSYAVLANPATVGTGERELGAVEASEETSRTTLPGIVVWSLLPSGCRSS